MMSFEEDVMVLNSPDVSLERMREIIDKYRHSPDDLRDLVEARYNGKNALHIACFAMNFDKLKLLITECGNFDINKHTDVGLPQHALAIISHNFAHYYFNLRQIQQEDEIEHELAKIENAKRMFCYVMENTDADINMPDEFYYTHYVLSNLHHDLSMTRLAIEKYGANPYILQKRHLYSDYISELFSSNANLDVIRYVNDTYIHRFPIMEFCEFCDFLFRCIITNRNKEHFMYVMNAFHFRIHWTGEQKNYLLHIAYHNWGDMFKYVLTNYLLPEEQRQVCFLTFQDSTILFWFMYHRNYEMVDYLLQTYVLPCQYSTVVNMVVDTLGNTLMHRFAKTIELYFAKKLLEDYGWDPTVKNKEGKYAHQSVYMTKPDRINFFVSAFRNNHHAPMTKRAKREEDDCV